MAFSIEIKKLTCECPLPQSRLPLHRARSYQRQSNARKRHRRALLSSRAPALQSRLLAWVLLRLLPPRQCNSLLGSSSRRRSRRSRTSQILTWSTADRPYRHNSASRRRDATHTRTPTARAVWTTRTQRGTARAQCARASRLLAVMTTATALQGRGERWGGSSSRLNQKLEPHRATVPWPPLGSHR